MKFSVLLPTHNRLELLRYAVQSVLLQDYQDWELIISDNYSKQKIEEYVCGLGDPRIKYFRTDRFVSVTENWNNTIERCSGKYVIMIGDDDCLLQGYFTYLNEIINNFQNPDLVYSNAILYAYPGTLPTHPNGLLRVIGNCDLWKQNIPFLLDQKTIQKMVKQTFNFRVAFSYNIQFVTISRQLIQTLKTDGLFFHSSYPDYYAMTLLWSKATKIVANPIPTTIIGINPKSFGYFYFNNKLDEGHIFLNNDKELEAIPELKSSLILGSEMNTLWLLALATVKTNNPDLKFEINIKRYRRLQIIEFMNQTIGLTNQRSIIKKYCANLTIAEKLTFGTLLYFSFILERTFGQNLKRVLTKLAKRILHSHPRYHCPEIGGNYKNIFEIFHEINLRKLCG